MDGISPKELFRRYYERSATAEEKARLFQLLKEMDDEKVLELIKDTGMDHHPDGVSIIPSQKAAMMLEKILGDTRPKTVVRPIKWRWYASAAAIILMVLGGYWFSLRRDQGQLAATKQEAPAKNEIVAGGNKAVLTLADGSQIILDTVSNGNFAMQSNAKLIKLNDGAISYQIGAAGKELLYNTIATPVGGQYQLILADGSKVWLNAISSLRFPIAFNGADRTVELTGEGYFEIAHDAAKPFNVLVNGVKVKVLGTHFNINAYNDEPQLKTTLLQGKVAIESVGNTKFLKPGQQAVVEASGGMQIVDDADVDEAVAWKNGKFIFNENNIRSVMRQLSRWYNIDVNYKEDLSADEYIGVISVRRSENISAVLNLLEKTKTVSFKVNGRSVTVMPYKK